MLYFLHGTDTIKVFEKSQALVEAMLKKKPDASIFKLNSENWEPSTLQELMVGQALFENKFIVQISRIFDDEEIKEVILDNLENLKKSENVFIWTEGGVDAKSIKKIEKHSERVQSFDSPQSKKNSKPSFNTFSLTDALGARDKKKLWLLYLEALEHVSVEEIHGILFWQVKSMLISLKAKSADEAGMKPFPYNKSKGFSKNFSEEELHNLSSQLISVSHDSRRGLKDFKISLEKFCLGV